jgi:hypothetical protein
MHIHAQDRASVRLGRDRTRPRLRAVFHRIAVIGLQSDARQSRAALPVGLKRDPEKHALGL